MRIVIDGRLWSESGLGRYIRNLVNELIKIDESQPKVGRPLEENEYYILLLQKDYDTALYRSKNFHKVLADFKWYGTREQIKLPKLLCDLKPDLVHFPHFNVPIFYRGKFVVTIHDLIHQHFQTRDTSTLNPLFHYMKKAGYKKVFSSATKNSSIIITPSEFVKGQLIKEWGIREDKIIVTHEGVDENLIKKIKDVGAKDFSKVDEKFGIEKPYLFYLGNAQPHKNLPRLISAFSKLKEKYSDLQLVLSGPNHHFWEKIKLEILRLPSVAQDDKKSSVIFTGFVSEEEMIVLYMNAEAFIMPSLEEGFGIPILEAMACGCPVVSSNAGSIPEVGGPPAGGAVLYFDPKDEKDMADKISQVLDDKKLRSELIKRGEKRYQEFSWQKLAQETLNIYNNIDGQ